MRLITVISLVVGLSLLGCSGSDPAMPHLGKVNGRVTQKGKPLSGGEVVFTPASGQGGPSGQVASGQIGSDGSYTLTTFNTGDGAILGTHKVTVTARSAQDLEKMNKLASGAIAYKLPKSQVSDKYSKTNTTPLTYTVKEGSNTIDIDLPE